MYFGVANEHIHVCQWLIMLGARVRVEDFTGFPSVRLQLAAWLNHKLSMNHSFTTTVLFNVAMTTIMQVIKKIIS